MTSSHSVPETKGNAGSVGGVTELFGGFAISLNSLSKSSLSRATLGPPPQTRHRAREMHRPLAGSAALRPHLTHRRREASKLEPELSCYCCLRYAGLMETASVVNCEYVSKSCFKLPMPLPVTPTAPLALFLLSFGLNEAERLASADDHAGCLLGRPSIGIGSVQSTCY